MAADDAGARRSGSCLYGRRIEASMSLTDNRLLPHTESSRPEVRYDARLATSSPLYMPDDSKSMT